MADENKKTVEVVKRFLMSTPTGALIGNGKLYELAQCIVDKLDHQLLDDDEYFYTVRDRDIQKLFKVED